MRAILYTCRLLVGSLFIVSGLIKANDTLGFSYKLQEYFEPEVLGWLMGFMEPYALPLAMLVCVGEIVLGVAVIMGGRMVLSTWFLLALILFFTGLTFYSAYFDKVTDCGCFGDAIKLTPWGSFTKDIALLVLILPIFWKRKEIAFNTLKEDLWMMPVSLLLIAAFSFGMLRWGFPFTFTLVVYAAALFVKRFAGGVKAEWIAGGVATLASVLFVHHTYAHLPVKDFRPYAVGKSIPEGMKIPEGEQGDVFESRLSYRNVGTGEVKQFTTQDYPWQDTLNWKWVSTDNTLIKKGYVPPIHDFQLLDVDGVDVTQDIVSETQPVLLVVIKNVKDADTGCLPAINELATKAFTAGWYAYVLTASGYPDIQAFKHEHQVPIDFLQCDETTLKTMVRSNPGVMLLKEGVVKGMWHCNDVPAFSEADELMD